MASVPQVARGVARKAQPEILDRAATLDDELQHFRDDYRPPANISTGQRAGRGDANEFPVKPSQPDKRDPYMDIKMDLVKEAQEKGNNSRFGQVTMSDEDVAWLVRKKQQEQLLGYDQFVADYFDLTSPAEANFFYGIAPEYLQQREAEIDQRAEEQKRLAKLRLRGPQSKEDLAMMFGIMSGQLKPVSGPLWDPKKWYPANDMTLGSSFQRGIFSPKRFVQGAIPGKDNRYDALTDTARTRYPGVAGSVLGGRVAGSFDRPAV